MNCRLRTIALAAMLATFLLADGAIAQVLPRPRAARGRYTPSPTLSPYLDYFRTPEGPLDSYHQFVRPQIQLGQILRQQEADSDMQAQRIQRLDSQLDQARRTGTLAPTGVGAAYFNYSHFYPTKR